MRIVSILILASLLGCGSTRTYLGQRVVDAPFELADGSTLMLPVTDGGPIPAEDDRIKIEVAGFGVSPMESSRSDSSLQWRFALTSKVSQIIERVVVEEVSANHSPAVRVQDDAPSLESGAWSGTTSPQELTRQSHPWLYSTKASFFVFKFTVGIKNEAQRVYYQPAWFSASVKSAIVQAISVPR